MVMTQADFIDVMSEAYGDKAVKANMTKAFHALFTAIGDQVADGEDVTIRGFGTFSQKETKERSGRNPHTGEPLTIPAGRKMKFKAAGALKARINNK